MRSALVGIFGVVVRAQTYLNLLYVWLAFPLGLFYFLFFVIGTTLGVALTIVLVGFFILLLVLAGWWGFAELERQMAIGLLRADIRYARHFGAPGKSFAQQLGGYFTDPVSWTGLLFLLLKFPLGLVTFIVAVFFVALSGALLTAPLTFAFSPIEISFTWTYVWVIDTLGEALLAFLIGLPVALITLHVHNGMAWLWKQLARVMVGRNVWEDRQALETA
jgi:hypothetical protein